MKRTLLLIAGMAVLGTAQAADPAIGLCEDKAMSGAASLIRPHLVDAFRRVEELPNSDADPAAMDWQLDQNASPVTANCADCEAWEVRGRVFNSIYVTHLLYDVSSGSCRLAVQSFYDSSFLKAGLGSP